MNKINKSFFKSDLKFNGDKLTNYKLAQLGFFIIGISVLIGIIIPILVRNKNDNNIKDTTDNKDKNLHDITEDIVQELFKIKEVNYKKALLRRQIKCMNPNFLRLTKNEKTELLDNIILLKLSRENTNNYFSKILIEIEKNIMSDCYQLIFAYYKHTIMIPFLENENDLADKIELLPNKEKERKKLVSEYNDYLSYKYGPKLINIKDTIREIFGEKVIDDLPSENIIIHDYLITFKNIKNTKAQQQIRDQIRKIWFTFMQMLPKHTTIQTDITNIDIYVNQIYKSHGKHIYPELFTDIILSNDIVNINNNKITVKDNIKKLLYLWILMKKNNCFSNEIDVDDISYESASIGSDLESYVTNISY